MAQQLICFCLNMGVIMRIVIVTMLILAGMISHSLATTFHYFYNGRVKSISDDTMAIGDKSFRVAEKVKVLQHEERNGAFYENPSNLRTVNVGMSVTVKVEGSVITEIIIERWKR